MSSFTFQLKMKVIISTLIVHYCKYEGVFKLNLYDFLGASEYSLYVEWHSNL